MASISGSNKNFDSEDEPRPLPQQSDTTYIVEETRVKEFLEELEKDVPQKKGDTLVVLTEEPLEPIEEASTTTPGLGSIVGDTNPTPMPPPEAPRKSRRRVWSLAAVTLIAIVAGALFGLRPSARGLFLEANAKFEAGEFREAIRLYTRVLDLDAGFVQAQFNRGLAHYELDELESCIRDCAAVLSSDPQFKKAYLQRGVARSREGDVIGAEADFTRAIECDPAYTEAYFNRGFVRTLMGDLEAAVADYTRALELAPNDPQIWHNRGVAYRRMGRLNQALADLDHALKLNPNSGATYVNRGLVYQDLHEDRAAIKDWNRAVAANAAFARRVKPRMAFSRLRLALRTLARHDGHE